MLRGSSCLKFLPIAIAVVLAGLALVDLRLAAVAGFVVALWMFARSAMALLK
jgi:hypothetical protein